MHGYRLKEALYTIKKKKEKTTSNHKPKQAKDYQNVPVLNASLHWPVATVLLLAQECFKADALYRWLISLKPIDSLDSISSPDTSDKGFEDKNCTSFAIRRNEEYAVNLNFI